MIYNQPIRHKNIFISFVVLLISFAFIQCQAQSKTGLLLALSKKDHTLSMIDPVTLKVLGSVPVGADPHEVIASSDGKTAYVSIYGGGNFHEINVIDIKAIKPITTIDTKPLYGPHGLVFAGGKLWFSAEGSMSVGSVDPATNKVDWSLGTGQDRTHMLYVTTDSKKIYTVNMRGGTVSILEDKATNNDSKNWIHTVVPVAKGCEGFDVLADQSELWTASAEDGKMYIVDLKNKKLLTSFEASVKGANRVKFSPDGKLAFVSSLQSGDLIVFDVKQRKEIQRLNFGRGCAGIGVDPDGSRLFVAYTADDFIAVIDLKTFGLITKLNVGGGPDGMAWAK